MPDTDLHKLSNGHPDDELLFALEPDQLVAASSRPLPRYVLGRSANLALWALRGLVLIITALVVYTFILSLR
jgi:hypothetical protein